MENEVQIDSLSVSCLVLLLNAESIITIFGGWASLLEIGPLVETTLQLRSAIASSGLTVEGELRLMEGVFHVSNLRCLSLRSPPWF